MTPSYEKLCTVIRLTRRRLEKVRSFFHPRSCQANLSYAQRISRICDLPEKYESLKHIYKDGITVHRDGHALSRISDFIMYSVEAEYIDRVVQQYGPSTKVGAIVAGQTSVKAPEKAAFESHHPSDVHIVSLHSLHGPTVSPVGQPLVIIKHRAPDESVRIVESIFRCFKSRYVYLTYEDHDLVTANVQAVTHAAFLTYVSPLPLRLTRSYVSHTSMGTAWAAQRSYPWEQGQYVGGIETVKVNIMLRIYSNKWHVYAGLAILNPSAKIQIDTYASSATDLFKLMLAGDSAGLRQRIYTAREKVFGIKETEEGGSTSIFLTEDVIDHGDCHTTNQLASLTPRYGGLLGRSLDPTV
ncbi:hypothetical protein HD554DRAFT_213777 [Boletus coccyginus]|nr:hypothetical protein HD554DRAFT_213777 [Boletus coccyginus]